MNTRGGWGGTGRTKKKYHGIYRGRKIKSHVMEAASNNKLNSFRTIVPFCPVDQILSQLVYIS